MAGKKEMAGKNEVKVWRKPAFAAGLAERKPNPATAPRRTMSKRTTLGKPRVLWTMAVGTR
jgi:hypothetical protein